jgi:site-specific recombinase XerD
VLKDILGHSEITTTMRYSHLAPSHLSDAVKLNPLNEHQ